MGKASRVKQASAREKIAAQRAAQRKQEIRNRMFLTIGSIVGVVIIVVAFLFVKALNKGGGSSGSSGGVHGTALPASVIKDITSVPAGTLASIGSGGAYAKTVSPVSAPALTSGGKPEILYMGAEYCPYCATERWAMVQALGRFGTFSGLHGIHSSSTDVYPSTPTLTFLGSHYTSKYLTFTPVETQGLTEGTNLQTPTSAQDKLFSKYDNAPYVSSSEADAIPFIDLGGKYLIHGAQYNPQLLQGKTWAEVAAALSDKSSAIAQGADGAANILTAAICKVTNNQPGSVCSTATISSLQGKL
jgi:thiol-disulfide isomerase/thioredoxin